MSAPVFVSPAAPPAGHAAAKRGAATPDADFAAILGETEANEIAAPARPATPAKAETAPAPAEVEITETPSEPAPEVVVAPPPVVAPLPAVPVPVPAAPSTAPATEETAAAAAPPAPSPELPDDGAMVPGTNAADADAPGQGSPLPTADADADIDIDQLAARAAQVEQARAAAPVPAQPTVATPPPVMAAAVAPPRPAQAPAQTPSVEAAEVDAADTQASDPATSDALTSDTPRTRDVIDRAQGARNALSGVAPTATSVAGAGDDQTPAASNPNSAAQSQGAPTASAPPRPAVTAATVVAPAPVAVDTPAVTAAAPPAATEAQPVETAVSHALSTLSHATIETTAQIAAQIVRKLEGRSTRFEMALTPDGLGQVDVSLDIDADGKLIARMAFDNPLAATELRGRVDDLRRQLQESGFTVADDALSFTERDPTAGGFSGQGEAFDRRPDLRNTRAFGAASRLEADADRLLTPPGWIPLALTPDRVDMKV